jgi:Hemerythrin HHE cation binding domain
MDVTKLLEADHRQVEELFRQIDAAKGDDRLPYIEELRTALKAHMELEEQVVYPAMGSVTGGEAVEEASTEHELARKSLAEMVDLAPDDPGFGAAMESTKAGIEHHVEEEENEVFPQLRKDGSVLAEIATPFMHKRMELGLPMDAEALSAAATKDELLAEAKNAGLDIVSSMTKEQVAQELATAMAGSA